ncbi:MAG: GtrA family protein [Clostridium saudiense]|uniref:GtrA family protein n=1 Tax=Clostridium saudiense TaxID=1414720 RepID=UPI0029155631|nr:GtrA family protein [Clostridium saudiense]MDU3520839.1 GtrA family protein [Clostridium saudiense]
MNNIRRILNKETISYVIFGILTTIVNLISYYFFSNIININYLISNTISWIISVVFAYITNKFYVFNSKDKRKDVMVKEFIKFVNCRLTSGVIEILLLFLLVDMMKVNDIISKLAIGVIVVVLNFIFSKIFVFQKVNQLNN